MGAIHQLMKKHLSVLSSVFFILSFSFLLKPEVNAHNLVVYEVYKQGLYGVE